MSGSLDYIVVKPVRLHLQADELAQFGIDVSELEDWPEDEAGNPATEGETIVAHGTRIPGYIAEGWGNDGRVVNHLTANGFLAPVPAGDAAGAASASPDPDRQALLERVAVLEAQLADAQEIAVTPEHEEDEAYDWLSENALVAFDVAAEEHIVAAVKAWGTGEGVEAVAQPPLETVQALRDHEAAHGNREAVLAALDANLADEEPEQVVDERPFPRHKSGGVFTLSDGTEVKGKAVAISAEAALAAPPSENT